jgi:hypothetical protein
MVGSHPERAAGDPGHAWRGRRAWRFDGKRYLAIGRIIHRQLQGQVSICD